MGIADDAPYILIARTLAATGHIFYNGWPAAMLGWQLYLGAAFVKLFGFSFTIVRMSTILVATILAFILQRTFVRLGLSERNATIGTLALVVSPIYLMLAVSFMSDIWGFFAIAICLYGCLRTLQSSSEGTAILWLCFAVASNAVCGTARQIAWLGILVMVPSTLYLLRGQRRTLIAGFAATFAGILFILGCLHWFGQQPYIQQEHILPPHFSVFHVFIEFLHTFLDFPFELFPIMALFLPVIFKRRPLVIVSSCALILLYVVLSLKGLQVHSTRLLFMEPAELDYMSFNAYGVFAGTMLQGQPSLFISRDLQIFLTAISFASLIGLILSFFQLRDSTLHAASSTPFSRRHFIIVLLPFTTAYLLLLIPRASSSGIYNRYALILLFIAIPFLVRYYQDYIQPTLPFASILLVAILAVCSVTILHNNFALYRARVILANELVSENVPITSVDDGWEYNLAVELQRSNHLNDPRIKFPANAYVAPPPPPSCPMFGYVDEPHIRPVYSVSFDPNACYGPAPFAPVHYSRWLARSPGTLYVVRSNQK
jgi:hypothetical protein